MAILEWRFVIRTLKPTAREFPITIVIENAGQHKRIISSIHDSCHLGVNRTLDMVASKYYWPAWAIIFMWGSSSCITRRMQGIVGLA